mgnify:FL=1
MKNNYNNIYNNLVKLTRNKYLYLNLNDNETFSDRIIFLLLHLSFFLKIYKVSNPKKKMQEIHDFIFKQVEISIREIGYGDVSINKNMKKYVNFFYDILANINHWEEIRLEEKELILSKFINNPKNISFYSNYFDNLCSFYRNNTLKYFINDIEDLKI